MRCRQRSRAIANVGILEMNVLDMRARVATLSPREKEVFGLVTAGLMNKQIAAESG